MISMVTSTRVESSCGVDGRQLACNTKGAGNFDMCRNACQNLRPAAQPPLRFTHARNRNEAIVRGRGIAVVR